MAHPEFTLRVQYNGATWTMCKNRGAIGIEFEPYTRSDRLVTEGCWSRSVPAPVFKAFAAALGQWEGSSGS